MALSGPEPHLILGLAHYHTKDYNAAVDDFKESIRLKDDQAMVYFQLGLAYLHLNQPSGCRSRRAFAATETRSRTTRRIITSWHSLIS